MNRFLRSLVDGALGGVAGTIAMTAVVAAARALGGARPPATRRLWTKALTLTRAGDLGHLGQRGHLRAEELLAQLGGARATAEHLGVGLGLGVVFGGLAFATRGAKLPIPVKGALFGGLVFAAHRLGLVPSPSFLDPDDATEPLDAPVSLAAHLAFGAALGVVVARLAPLALDAGADANAADAAEAAEADAERTGAEPESVTAEAAAPASVA